MPHVSDSKLERELMTAPKTYLQSSSHLRKVNLCVFVEITVNQLFCYLQPYSFLDLQYMYKALQFPGDLLLPWLILF